MHLTSGTPLHKVYSYDPNDEDLEEIVIIKQTHAYKSNLGWVMGGRCDEDKDKEEEEDDEYREEKRPHGC